MEETAPVTPPASAAMSTTSESTASKKPDPRRKRDLLSLNHDIKTLIVDYITRPTDLKNLCLTCKELQELAVKPLYKEIVLELGGTNDTKLTAFVNPRNIGLKWIRKLDLYLAELPSLRDPEKTAYLMQANFSIRLLIEMLPNNILERFSWHPWTLFGADNLQLLYKKQRKMKWLEAIALDRNILPELEKWHDWPGVFEHATKLGLYPDSQDVLNYSAALLQRTKNLEKMTLHTSFDEDPDSATISTRELNDSSTGPGLITRTIFSHMMPFDNCTPIALRDLTLQKINLRYAADTYCRVIDFRQLKALRIFNCAGADALFAELSRSSRLPEKLEIIEFKHDDNAENDALNALDCLLTLVTGLKVMTFDLTFVKALPAVAGIVRNAKTLKELIVHASSGDHEEEELVYSFEDFEKICKNCEQLEQVSIAFPATSIVRENSDEFAAFENALGDLANLVTLNITTWPNTLPNNIRLPRKKYETLLQGMAQDGFERSIAHAREHNRSSQLAVIAWGASDKCYDRRDSKTQIIYVKGKQTQPFGKELPIAVQVGWCLRKFIEPRSEILDYALARNVKPPTREPPSSEDSD